MSRILLIPLFLIPLLSSAATIEFSGLVQQEFVGWGSDASGTSGKALSDGGLYRKDHNLGGASFVSLSASESISAATRALGHISYNLLTGDGRENSEREIWLGIDNSKSLWRFGSIVSPYQRSTIDWDPMNSTFMQARGNGATSIHHYGTIENSIDYSSQWYGTDIDVLYAIDSRDDNSDGNADRNDTTSLALTKKWADWELSLGHIDDGMYDRGGATKLAVRYQGDSWSSSYQYERLTLTGLTAMNNYWNLAILTERSEYVIGIGRGTELQGSTELLSTRAYYVALGMKHAFSQQLLMHLGYRLTVEDTPNDQKESAFGIGMRFSF